MKCASLTDFPLLIILIYLSNLLYQKLPQTKHACILLVCFSSRIKYDLKKITSKMYICKYACIYCQLEKIKHNKTKTIHTLLNTKTYNEKFQCPSCLRLFFLLLVNEKQYVI